MSDPYSTAATKATAIQTLCHDHFGVNVTIKRIIADRLFADKNSYVTVFKTATGDIYAFCRADSAVTLRDVKQIASRVGITNAVYLPPAKQPDYFFHYGTKAFQASFPSRALPPDDELTYYKSLAPYNPALIKVSEIPGELRHYVPAVGHWQKALDFTYRQLGVTS